MVSRLESRCLLSRDRFHIRRVTGRHSTTTTSFPLPSVPSSRSRTRPKKLSETSRKLALRVCCKTDYSPSASDEEILQKPAKEPLQLDDVRNVFGYPRNIKDKYVFGEIIGTGSYGIVKKCVERETGAVFAVKIVPKAPKRGYPCTPRYLLKLRSEVEVMQQLGASLDAVYLQGAFEDDDHLYLVMELCKGGSLLSRVAKGKETEKSIAYIARSILRFIAQCHARGIVYRDVKTENFLFLNQSSDSSVKATDFGLSIRHSPTEEPLTSRTGTPVYMAPEVILQSYGSKCDVWSTGMLIFQLLTGRFFHWKDLQKTKLKDLWRSVVTIPVDLETSYWQSKLSKDVRDLLGKMLKRDPNERLSAAEALKHPWIREGGTARDMLLEGSVVQRLQRFATYGELKQLILIKVSEEIQRPDANEALLEELKHLFDVLDTDNSGSISTDELAEGLRAQGYFVSDDEAHQLLSKVDVDKSGYIDFDEFMATLVDWSEIENNNSEWSIYLDKIFAIIDKDGNGYISLDELIDYIPPNTSRQRLSAAEIEAKARLMLREADKNKDGQISKEEFFELMQNTVMPDALEQYDSRVPDNVK